MAEPESTVLMELARTNLSAKLAELRRREARVRVAVAPIRQLANPWLQIGVAAVVGYRLGRPSRAVTTVVGGGTLIHALVRASVVAVAQALVRRVVELVDER